MKGRARYVARVRGRCTACGRPIYTSAEAVTRLHNTCNPNRPRKGPPVTPSDA